MSHIHRSYRVCRTRLFYISLLLAAVGLMALAFPLSNSQAELPPRTPPPQPTADGGAHHGDRMPAGAYIELELQNPTAGAWAVVQWQDSGGNWHDVEAWGNPVDPDGCQRWWVASSDFGSGPFRWLVSAGQGGEQLAVSESFHLPAVLQQTLLVGAAIAP